MISVIVPVYNSEAYIDDLFRSLLGQTYKNFEVIAIDDTSTDNSLSILQKWEEKYPKKIHVYHNTSNMGVGATRNKGLLLAQGEYISFLDSDDFIHPQMFQDMYLGANFYDFPDIVCSGLVFVKESAFYHNYFNSYRRSGTLINPLGHDLELISESPSCGNKLFKREFLGDDTFLVDTMWEDYAFSYAHLFSAKSILLFHNPDYYYRKHDDKGISASGLRPNKKLMDAFLVADNIKSVTDNRGKYNNFKDDILLLQVLVILYRIREVLDWKIDNALKREIAYHLYHLAKIKYTSIYQLDQDLLSMRIDFQTVGFIKEFPSLNLDENTTKQHLDEMILSLKR